MLNEGRGVPATQPDIDMQEIVAYSRHWWNSEDRLMSFSYHWPQS